MFDAQAARLIAPAITKLAGVLHAHRVSADALTWLGFALGMAAALAIAWGSHWTGLALILASRLCDGLDGAVARLGQPTDRGGFLDITLDMLFYAAIPLAFAWNAPQSNALAAASVLASFIGTSTSFLAYAVMVEKRRAAGKHTEKTPQKSFFFLGGLTEATETLVFFCAACIWPQYFAPLAYVFAALCTVTIITRIWAGLRNFD